MRQIAGVCLASSFETTLLAGTCAAATFATRAIVGIRRIVGMSLRAVGLGAVAFARDTAQRVLAVGDRLKVSRVHARGVAAKVVQLLSEGDRADKGFVGEPVCLDGLVGGTEHEPSVATLALARRPFPAAGRGLDLCPEPDCGIDEVVASGPRDQRRAVSAPTLIVRATQATRLDTTRAIWDGAGSGRIAVHREGSPFRCHGAGRLSPSRPRLIVSGGGL